MILVDMGRVNQLFLDFCDNDAKDLDFSFFCILMRSLSLCF